MKLEFKNKKVNKYNSLLNFSISLFEIDDAYKDYAKYFENFKNFLLNSPNVSDFENVLKKKEVFLSNFVISACIFLLGSFVSSFYFNYWQWLFISTISGLFVLVSICALDNVIQFKKALSSINEDESELEKLFNLVSGSKECNDYRNAVLEQNRSFTYLDVKIMKYLFWKEKQKNKKEDLINHIYAKNVIIKEQDVVASLEKML